jgi:choline dehydrogenase-like flavoprotein
VLQKNGARVSTIEHLMSACAGLGIDNLFVADPSVFPTGPSVDPSVSIMAFSYIAAEHIANAMGKKTAPLQNT